MAADVSQHREIMEGKELHDASVESAKGLDFFFTRSISKVFHDLGISHTHQPIRKQYFIYAGD